MTKKEQNIINVLAALSNDAYDLYVLYDRNGDNDKANQYWKESDAYYNAARIVVNEKFLKLCAKFHNVDLIK